MPSDSSPRPWQADMANHQVSEILPLSGVVLAGLLQDEVQNTIPYGHADAADTRLAGLERQFVAALCVRDGADFIRANGMQLLPSVDPHCFAHQESPI